MIYLASPYWDPAPIVRHQRYRAACRATLELMRAGQTVFSPVVYGHPLMQFGASGDWDFWRPHDLEYLRRCDEVVVLTLGNWEVSRGVQAELRQAREWNKPIRFIAPHDAPGATTTRPDAVVEQPDQVASPRVPGAT